MTRVIAVCNSWWCCTPRYVQWFLLFLVASILGDLISFPFAHTFWNLVHFEGWFANE